MADLSGARLSGEPRPDLPVEQRNFGWADLKEARLEEADLSGANLREADLSEANLSGADLQLATLVNTDLTLADLTGCRIHGVSAWHLTLEGTKQQNLVSHTLRRARDHGR